MNRILTAILVTLIVLGSIITSCQSNEGATVAPEVGKIAPDFQFQGPDDDQATSLSDLKGEPVLINFWATWCSPCAYEMPYLQQIYDEWQAKGLVLLAINIGESSSQVAEFMQNHGLSFPVLLDSEGNIAQQYGIRYIPTSFFIGKDGIIKDIKSGAFQSQAEIESILSKLK
jgi:peroxiredoxin